LRRLDEQVGFGCGRGVGIVDTGETSREVVGVLACPCAIGELFPFDAAVGPVFVIQGFALAVDIGECVAGETA
jgi:hypothetical protein